MRVRSDGSRPSGASIVNLASRGPAVRDRQIAAMHLACRDRPNQAGHRRQRLADDHQARGVLVEAMHDAGARQRGAGRIARQQGIEQGARPVARRRVHDHAGRLVDDQQVFVFVDDDEGQRLGTVGAALGRGQQRHGQALPGAQPLRRAGDDELVDAHLAAADQSLQIAARKLRSEQDDSLVQPFAVLLRRDSRVPRLGRLVIAFAASVRPFRQRAFGLRFSSTDHIRFAFDSAPTSLQSATRPPGFLRMTMMTCSKRSWLTVSAISAAVVLSGCDTTLDETAKWSPEKLYAEAKEEAASGNYEKAAKLYERLEGRAAGTVLAQQAQLEHAYVLWKSGEKAQALSTLERFIKLHPTSPAFDYALYLQGLINFNDDIGFLGSLTGQDFSERDQQAERDAFQSFRQLVEQFPQSAYADDARLRMNFILNTLAAYEVHVARYYFRRGAYIAAANRAQQTVLNYQQSPSTEEALFIMARSYDQLGLTQLRDDAERVLKQNFPNTTLDVAALGVNKRSHWWQLW